jgi:hypothetical protein
MWDFLQKNNDEKMQYLADNYLPLTGGTMSGDIRFNANLSIGSSVNNGTFTVQGGSAWDKGSYLELHGKDEPNLSGCFYISAKNDNNTTALLGYPSGTLTWGGQNILTASNYNSYALPLSGGTMTGSITASSNYFNITHTQNVIDGRISISGGNGENYSGGVLYLYGSASPVHAGNFLFSAEANNVYSALEGQPDGTLTWGGQPIQTSSDKRLKQDFSAVPADVLEAWGKVEWQQFKYKADAERKGENCRFHTGLVAQDVKEVGEENHVDLLRYGILCHDVREAVEEEKDENGNVIKEASEAVDLWTVRYEEALAMEVIYLRNEIKKLREEIKALRTE